MMKRGVFFMGVFFLAMSFGVNRTEARMAPRCTSKEAIIFEEGASNYRCGIPGASCRRIMSWGRTFECASSPLTLTRTGPSMRKGTTSRRFPGALLRSSRERRKLAREQRRKERAPLPKTPLPSPLHAEKTQPNQLSTPALPLPSLKAVSTFLLLGSKSSFLATIEVTPQDEPVHVREIRITLVDPLSSVTHFEVSDDLGFVLGNATRNLTASSAGDVYSLTLSPASAYFIERRDTIVLGVRAMMKEKDEGGAAGETLQVEDIDITATGLWTEASNAVSTFGTDFQKHQTANAVLRKIENRGKEESTFTTGSSKIIGSFRFEAQQNSDADPALSALAFSVSAPSEVTLSNVILRDPSGGSSQSCSLSSGTITCSSIADSLGSLQSPRSLDVVADVAISGSHPDPFLQIELNSPGRPGSPGAITWTDGDATFTWVPLDPPIAQGTLWK